MSKTYKELLTEAEKTKTIQPITADYIKWEKEGQSILGRFIASAPVNSSMSEGTYNQYLFETDDGLVKFALGQSHDNEIGKVMKRGSVYHIVYEGKEDLPGGRKFKKFTCSHVPFASDDLDVLDDGTNPFLENAG